MSKFSHGSRALYVSENSFIRAGNFLAVLRKVSLQKYQIHEVSATKGWVRLTRLGGRALRLGSLPSEK